MPSPAPLILCWTMRLEPAGGAPGDVAFYAMTEGGEMLYSTVTSRNAAEAVVTAIARFDRRFPGGYVVEHVENPGSDARVKNAVAANRKLGAEGDRRL
jgi:hypothetical protein